MKIPQDKLWKGMFPGNYFGNIWQTRNIDMGTSPGRIMLGEKMRILLDDTDTNLSNLITVTKFLRSDADAAATARYWAVCGNGATGGRLFKTPAASPTGAWAEETQGTGDTPPTTVLDIEIFESLNGEQQMLAVLPTDVALLNSPATANRWDVNWGTTVPAVPIVLTTATLHPIGKLNKLIAIGNGNVLQTIDKDSVVTNSRLTMPFGYSIRNIYSSSDRFWIGCTNLIGTDAKIIEWDGSLLAFNNQYDLIGDPVCGFIVNNVPYFITNFGYIYKFTGSTFEIIQQFPQVEESLPTLNISNYGVAVVGHKVYILAKDTLSSQTASRKFRSGIWEFDTKTLNLNHQRGIGASKVAGTDPDFGQSPPLEVGALKFSFVDDSNVNLLIAGGKFYSAYTGTGHWAIWRAIQNRLRFESAGFNRGYFITTYIPIAEIEAMWEGLWIKFKRFVDSTNRIVVWGRVTDPKLLASGDLVSGSSRLCVEADITWQSTTTFSGVIPTGVAVGNSMEILTGNGAGCVFYISALQATPDGSDTVTLEVDEAIPSLNASGSRGALARFDNFVRLGTISSTSIGNQKLTMPSSQQGEFVQFLIELRGYEVEVDEIQPLNKVKTEARQG